MSLYHDEDEFPFTHENSTVRKPRPFISAKTKLTVTHSRKVPLGATKFSLLLELTNHGPATDKAAVDIVTVLDVSGSMEDENKLQKMKTAMHFLIKKLSPIHRLSVVTFSSKADKKCPLRWMTEDAQEEIGCLINGLAASGGTNIAGGLRLALKELQESYLSRGSIAAIMLISDGDQGRRFDDARDVPIRGLPVFTFGFGKGSDYNPQVLNAIATNSEGGTFSVVDAENTESNALTIAFDQCLAGLLSVVVQDLELTVKTVESDVIIKNVSVGCYPVTGDGISRTISFGHLYDGEERRVLVELDLPPCSNERGYDVLEIYPSYVYDDEHVDAAPVIASVLRSQTYEPVNEEHDVGK